MPTRISTAARNAAADAIVDRVDAGPAAGRLKVYTGTQPAGPDSAATGTLLADFALADPAFGNASSGSAALAAVANVNASATGTAGWFRVTDSTGTAVFDGSITATGGGGDLEMTSTSLTSGSPVQITGGSFTQPASE